MTSDKCEHRVNVGASPVNMLEDEGGAVVCSQCDARWVPEAELRIEKAEHQDTKDEATEIWVRANQAEDLLREARALIAVAYTFEDVVEARDDLLRRIDAVLNSK